MAGAAAGGAAGGAALPYKGNKCHVYPAERFTPGLALQTQRSPPFLPATFDLNYKD